MALTALGMKREVVMKLLPTPHLPPLPPQAPHAPATMVEFSNLQTCPKAYASHNPRKHRQQAT